MNSRARLLQRSVFEPAFDTHLSSTASLLRLFTRLIVSDYSVWLVSTPLISQHSSNISIWSKSIVASVLQHVPLNTTNRFGACSAEFKINSLLLPFLSSPFAASQIHWNQPSVSERVSWRIIELGKQELSQGWRYGRIKSRGENIHLKGLILRCRVFFFWAYTEHAVICHGVLMSSNCKCVLFM